LSSAPPPRLAALATATPRHRITQDVAAAHAGEMFAATHGGAARIAPIFHNAKIENRYSGAGVPWFLEPHSFSDRNDLFLETAVDLIGEAADEALAAAGLSHADIDTIVTVCSTGIATPALDARLMEVRPFRRDVRRLPVFGLGCAGGVLGLARAADMARAAPGSRVLLLVVELCTLTFRHGDRSKSNLVATALFGDGAAAAVIGCDAALEGRPRLGAAAEHTWPDSLGVMGWDVADDGLKVVFSRDIPTLVRNDFPVIVERFLTGQGITLADIDGFVCHPGGAKVLDALEETFSLEPGGLVESRAVLRDYGNMSAATVLFVLKQVLEAGPGRRLLLTTLGPGFTAGVMLVETGA
jgi:alkylresorcinol/alkylpyrone synthase